jgi:prolipoprotein diacylglyceryltransferase
MFANIINAVKGFISTLNPFLGLVLIFLLGLFVFWKESSRSRKNNSSVFDIFFISVIIGILIGRLVYIISNWVDFSSLPWYWLPYERYGDDVYLFRLLPWKLLKIWDGQLDILFTFLGIILMQTISVLFLKKWKWGDLFPPIYLSNWVMMGLSYFFVGIQSGNNLWLKQGWIILIPFIVFIITQAIILKVYLGSKKEEVSRILYILFAVVALFVIGYVYISLSLTTLTTIGFVILSIWYVAGIIAYIISSRQEGNVTIKTVSSVRQVSLPEVSKPVRLN